jgi:hypothetical protein
MKKIVILTAVGLLFISTLPLFAQNSFELGISFTPILSEDKGYESEEGKELNAMLGFHAAYSWLIFYGAWDSLAVPPPTILSWTGYANRAGFLNLFGVGIRLLLGPFALYSTIGVNTLYVYKQDELEDLNSDFGANLRIGAGLKFGIWGVNASGTAVFPAFDDIVNLFKDLADPQLRDWAIDKLMSRIVPSINLFLYL